ncbi:Copia protein [Fusarium oxysporum f. sp. rapae]|uniref:Copia protein n=1 Tax=Fusarium oxysporum f. sp. rapae TaxID=485398 RepID=A0A8J5UG83_FUSOX|nr:Copia protein [Fusarium oxysporum f. sp. rapae]
MSKPVAGSSEVIPKDLSDAEIKDIRNLKDLKLRLPTEQFLRGYKQWPAWKRHIEISMSAAGTWSGIELSSRGASKLLVQMQTIVADPITDFLSQYNDGRTAYQALCKRFDGATVQNKANIWSDLLSLKLKDPKNTINHVDQFRILVKRYQAAGGEIPKEIERETFISSVEGVFDDWVGRLRFNQRLTTSFMPSVCDLQDDVVDESKRIWRQKKKEKGTQEKKPSNTAMSTQSQPQQPQQRPRKDFSEYTCHSCGQKGHIKRLCPNEKSSDTAQKSANPQGSGNRSWRSHYISTDKEDDKPDGKSSFSCHGGKNTHDVIAKAYKKLLERSCDVEKSAFYLTGDVMQEEVVCEAEEGAHRPPNLKIIDPDVCDEDQISQRESLQHQNYIAQSLSIDSRFENEKDRWLWDTGSDLHVINNEKWYRDGEWAELEETVPIITGGGTVYPTAVGTALVTLHNGSDTNTISLTHTVLVRDFPLNIFSGEKLYLAGGYLQKNNVVNRSDEVITTIDVKARGFLLQVVGGVIGSRQDHKAMLTSQEIRETKLWHRRLVHSSYEAVNKTMKATTGGIHPTQLVKTTCDPCELAKSTRYTPKDTRERAAKSLQRVHFDLCEFKPVTPEGYRMMLLANDDKSRWKRIQLLRRKADASAAVEFMVEEWMTMTESSAPIELQFDGGREFINSYTRNKCRQRGIRIIITPPHSHEQNGPVERSHRAVLEKARTAMIEADIPLELWGEILLATVHVMNITASVVLDWKTPHEVLYDDYMPGDNKPSISHLRTLGCKAFVNIEPEKRVKSEKSLARGWEGILVGYQGKHLYKIWNPKEKKVVITSHVVFHEKVPLPADYDVVRTRPPGAFKTIVMHSQRRADPPTVIAALAQDDGPEWREAFYDEIKLLFDSGCIKFEFAFTEDSVILLGQAIYGLKQSGRQWQKKLREEMKKIDMTQIKSDTAVYLDHIRKIITLSYVDDLLTSAPDEAVTASYYKDLRTNLEIKEMGFPQLFLGVVLQQISDGIALDQKEYIKGILEDFDMINCNSVSTPMEPGSYHEAKLEKQQQAEAVMKEKYASIVGKVNYLVSQTRPDIAFANGLWARFLSNPTENQFSCAKRLLRYLQQFIDLRIRYRKISEEEETFGNPS